LYLVNPFSKPQHTSVPGMEAVQLMCRVAWSLDPPLNPSGDSLASTYQAPDCPRGTEHPYQTHRRTRTPAHMQTHSQCTRDTHTDSDADARAHNTHTNIPGPQLALLVRPAGRGGACCSLACLLGGRWGPPAQAQRPAEVDRVQGVCVGVRQPVLGSGSVCCLLCPVLH
jgi:hypothetical protein